jgi:adenosylmethionine-8-amino-7-oxononanoate aminotransferase
VNHVDTKQSKVFHRELDRLYPILTHGEGVWLQDAEGRRFLDAISGGSLTANIGYGVKPVVDAVSEQTAKLAYYHNQKATTTAQEEAAAAIAQRSPQPDAKVFFTSCGHDANETAIRLARKYHYDRGDKDRTKIISFFQSYHGSTMGTLSLTGRPGLRGIYTPYLPQGVFFHVPPIHDFRPLDGIHPPDNADSVADRIEEIIEREGPETVSAFFCEPIHTAAAPAMTPPQPFWLRLKAIAEKYGILVIFDEVVAGAGRTGSWFYSEQLPLIPDITATAKGWGSGYVYLGPLIVSGKIVDTVAANSREFGLGTTINGSPVACAGVTAVIRYIESENLLDRVTRLGKEVLERLQEKLSDVPIVGAVRGKGFLLGVEYADPETKEMLPETLNIGQLVYDRAYERGLITYSVAPNADGFVGDSSILGPAYTATEEDLNEMVNRFCEAVYQVQEDYDRSNRTG